MYTRCKGNNFVIIDIFLLNRDAISRAKEMIYDIVSRGEAPPMKGGRAGNVMGPPGIDMGGGGGGGGNSTVEISVPGPKVGLIIGKGGETIKQLQEKSGAKMVIIQDGPQQESEKPLRITGDPHKVSMIYNNNNNNNKALYH